MYFEVVKLSEELTYRKSHKFGRCYEALNWKLVKEIISFRFLEFLWITCLGEKVKNVNKNGNKTFYLTLLVEIKQRKCQLWIGEVSRTSRYHGGFVLVEFLVIVELYLEG
jgi:hypothetical protein